MKIFLSIVDSIISFYFTIIWNKIIVEITRVLFQITIYSW